MAPGVQLEQAERGGVAVGRVAPAQARRIPVQRSPPEGRILDHQGEAEVDDLQPVVAHQQVVGLEVLVRDALLLQVLQRGQQVLGIAPQGVQVGLAVLLEPAAQGGAPDPFHDQRQPILDHLGEVDHPHDGGVVQAAQDLVLAAQGLLGRIVGTGDLQGPDAARDQVLGRVDHGQPTFAEPVRDLVVRPHPIAGLEVVRVGRASPGKREQLDAGTALGLQRGLDGPPGVEQAGESLRAAQREHAGDGLVHGGRQAGVEVPGAQDQPPVGQQVAGALEEEAAGDQQTEQRAEAELVRGRGGAAEGLEHLGRREAQALVGERGQRHGDPGLHLLGQVEAGDPQVGIVRLVLDQDHLGPQQAMHDALLVRGPHRVDQLEPEADAGLQVLQVLAPRQDLPVSLQPGRQGDAGEVLEGQHDARFVLEGGIGPQDVGAAPEAPEHLGFPAGTGLDALLLRLVRQGRQVVDAQHPHAPVQPVLAEHLRVALAVLQRLLEVVLADAVHRLRAVAVALEQPQHLALDRERDAAGQLPAAEALDQRLVLECGQDGLAGVHPAGAGRAPHVHVRRRGEEDEALDPDPGGLEVLPLQEAVEHLAGLPVELQRAADGVRYVPVVVVAVDLSPVGLDLHHVDGVRRHHDRVDLVHHAGALDQPGVAVDGVGGGQPLLEEGERLQLCVVGRLADLDEVRGHRLHQHHGGVGEQLLQPMRQESSAFFGS